MDYPILQCEPRPKAQHIHTFPANSGNGSGCGGLFEVVSVRLGRPVEVQCGIENPPPLLAKRRPTKRPPNPADCFGRNVRNVRNVFGAVCFAHTGVSGTSVSVRHEFCVAVRVDLLKALSHYVKCIAKSFNISVRYKCPVTEWIVPWRVTERICQFPARSIVRFTITWKSSEIEALLNAHFVDVENPLGDSALASRLSRNNFNVGRFRLHQN